MGKKVITISKFKKSDFKSYARKLLYKLLVNYWIKN